MSDFFPSRGRKDRTNSRLMRYSERQASLNDHSSRPHLQYLAQSDESLWNFADSVWRSLLRESGTAGEESEYTCTDFGSSNAEYTTGGEEDACLKWERGGVVPLVPWRFSVFMNSDTSYPIPHFFFLAKP